MASSSFPSQVTGVTVETATAGALSGDGSSGNKLAVGVDGTTIDVNGSNQLEALGAAVAFKTIAVSGQSSIVADAADDTLTIVAGSNITLTTNAGTDTLMIAASGGGGGTPSGWTWDASALASAAGDLALGTTSGSSPYLAWDHTSASFLTTVQPMPVDAAGGNGPVYVPVLAGAGAGNLSNGVYYYAFTQTTPSGETAISGNTPTVTVVDHTANGKVRVPWPNAFDTTYPLTTKIYRTAAGGSQLKLVATVDPSLGAANPYVDNIADASLGANAPTVATAIEPGLSFTGDAGLRGVFSTSYGVDLINLVPTAENYAATSQISIQPQTGSGIGTGLVVYGGGAYNGNGGGLTLHGGDTQGVDALGFGSTSGGQVTISGGLASPSVSGQTGVGGDVIVTAGASAGAPGTTNTSGNVKLQSGDGTSRLIVDLNGNVTLPEVLFSALPSSPPTGSMANVSDSNANTWGATVGGSGSNHVLVRYNGSNWTVVGK